MAAIQPGFCLGPYEVKDILGSGALGVVYRARQSSLERDVALKVLSTSLAMDDELVERFRREARTAASLRHPHIVTVYDHGCADGFHYIAMELLDGTTLDGLTLPLAPGAAAEILRQLAEALAYAHKQGVVHRDLKPENALIDDEGCVTLTDFGVARVIGQASLTLGGGPIGTPEFMSPEQARGETADARCDIYSLGVLGYYLVTGISPFRAETALATMYRQIHDELPPLPESVPASLREWIERSCSKQPEKRFGSGEETRGALGAVLAGADAWSAGANPLDSILRGEMSLSEALAVHKERGAEIRSTFQKELTVICLDVVRSSLLKAPGQTILASFTFAAFRRYVAQHLESSGCLTSNWSGDGLIALFPAADPAVGAAVRILRGLPVFNNSESGLEDPVLVRIGIHTGRILMSDSQRLEQIASSTLDIAGRLQKSAAPNSLLMSESTRTQLTQTSAWKPVESLPGIHGPVFGATFGPVSLPGRPAPPPPSHSERLQLPVPLPDAASTVVRAGSFPVSARSELSPAHILLPGSAQLRPWLPFAIAATLFGIFAVPGTSVGPMILWIASLVVAIRALRQGAAAARSLAGWSIGGIITTGAVHQWGLEIVLFIAMCIGGASVIERQRQVEKALQEQARSYVVLERLGTGGIELPPAAKDLLLDEMGSAARRLGYPERQLAVRMRCDVSVHRVRMTAQLIDRDTGTELASAELDGDVQDTRGLTADLASRLSGRLAGSLASSLPRQPEPANLLLPAGPEGLPPIGNLATRAGSALSSTGDPQREHEA